MKLVVQQNMLVESGHPSDCRVPLLAFLFLPITAVLLFLGAVLWARGRDPFQRIWFNVKTATSGNVECVAVLPRMSRPSGKIQRLPLVVYLHGSGDSLTADGNDLRQMAEMNLAAVSMEYNKTNKAARDEQLMALLAHLGRQRWVDTNRVAWVGLSLGAQHLLSFALTHPDLRPRLLVRLGGGRVPELEPAWAAPTMPDRKSLMVQKRLFTDTSVLLVHGELDEVFPLADARRVVAWFRTNGVPVHLRVLAGQPHAFGENRPQVFRGVGEYCLTQLEGPSACENYQSILAWQSRATPLWAYWIPATGWVGLRTALRWRTRKAPNGAGGRPLTLSGKLLRSAACILAALALSQTALHVVPPRMNVSSWTLGIARSHLVAPKETEDFNYLSAKPIWQGKKLGTLLEHVELARYNTYELINWKVEANLYRNYVLWPNIDAEFDGTLKWRRALWKNFYPRIRKEHSPTDAAVIVARFLRERVTIACDPRYDTTIDEAWERQITGERGFDALYVAALRSVGIPARLVPDGKAELWDGFGWRPAPRPLIEEVIGLEAADWR